MQANPALKPRNSQRLTIIIGGNLFANDLAPLSRKRPWTPRDYHSSTLGSKHPFSKFVKMTKKRARIKFPKLGKAKKKPPKFESALDHKSLSANAAALAQDDLYDLWSAIRGHRHWAIGDPTEQSISAIRDSNPLLQRIINFDRVVKRLQLLPRFDRSTFGVSIDEFFPELKAIEKECERLIYAIPNGISKAERWLRVVALGARSELGIEAAIYFASRGKAGFIDREGIRQCWYAQVCRDVETGARDERANSQIIERARQRTLSLDDAAKVLRFGTQLPRFFSFRDEEEDMVDPAMFRAVEWLGITGFEPWLESSIVDLSTGPLGGVEHTIAGWSLFYWCRSDLAIRMADRSGLESWLWSLTNGQYDRQRPWAVWWDSSDDRTIVDYLPLAAHIVFMRHRLEILNERESVFRAALDLLLTSQLANGSWPLISGTSDSCLMATYSVVHALGMAKPNGWKAAVKRARDWLLSQQNELGFWTIDGGPTVAITVLVMDALAIADGSSQLTFKREGAGDHELTTESTIELDEPRYDCSNMPWHQPLAPRTVSKSLTDAKQIIQPSLALLVATDIELRQVLHLLRPVHPQRSILKVSHGHETAYLGRFGAFNAVVVLCTMGPDGPSGATLTSHAVIQTWDPTAIVFIGIAFGSSRKKHMPADVLVATQLIPYESQRRGKQTQYRNPVPPTGGRLLARFRNAIEWQFDRPDATACQVHFGPVLSGNKLVDDPKFKSRLLSAFPGAIGGEMEGAGLWSSAARAGKEWALVKSVCDWGDGKKHSSFQEMAAASASSLCFHVFNDPHALDGF